MSNQGTIEKSSAEWATTFRGIWHSLSQDIFIGAGTWKEFNNRNEMRWNAWRYAGARGWTVALTPPQRRTPAPSTGAGEVTP